MLILFLNNSAFLLNFPPEGDFMLMKLFEGLLKRSIKKKKKKNPSSAQQKEEICEEEFYHLETHPRYLNPVGF